MFKRYAVLGILIVMLSACVSAPNATGQAAKRQKIVLQASDIEPAKWNLVLNNAKNVQEELGAANVDIEIIAFGPGINMLKFESVVNTRVADAIKAGIKIIACENSLRNFKLTRADMEPSISYVPAGVVHIMRRQGEGWAYLRP